MDRRKSLYWLSPILILVCVLAQPSQLKSQCSVTNTMVVPGTAGSPYNRVYKTLNNGYLCNRVASNNASLCAPGPTAILRTRVTASAATTAVSPSCSFVCTGGCGAITITGSDGLPVELMDFGVEDGMTSMGTLDSSEDDSESRAVD